MPVQTIELPDFRKMQILQHDLQILHGVELAMIANLLKNNDP